jgi:Domain of unknown function (DUF6089)
MMKTTKTRFFQAICLATLCFFSLIPRSQAQFEAGVFAGASNYQGDLADGAVIWRETQLSYGALMRYTPNRFWSLRAHYIQGNIQASDRNSSNIDIRYRGFKFKSTLHEFAAIGEFNFLGKEEETANDFSFMVNPYLFGGVGVVAVNGTPVAPADTRPYPFPEAGAKKTFLTIPMGIGVKIKPSPSFSLGIEWGARTAFSDRLDGVSSATQAVFSRGNDWYMFGGMTFTYFFNSQY